MPQILEGIRVLEWAVWHSGPGATMMLGDLGAEVIKLEHPVTGDPMRGLVKVQGRDVRFPKALTSGGLGFHVVNRNKKSVAIDLSKKAGKEMVYRLVEKCDVFLQNFRKGVTKKAGMDYETLVKYNPKLVYANITGYGPKGPDSDKRAQDYAALARSGMLTAAWGSDGELPQFGPALVDQAGSMMAAYGVVSALLGRERLGIGQEVDVSLLGSAICLQNAIFGYSLMLGEELPKQGRAEQGNPLYNHYRCADGRWIAFAVVASERVWPDFCRAIDAPELENDARFGDTDKRSEHRRELVAILDGIFATKKAEEWIAILSQYRRIMVSAVKQPLEVAEDPQTLANDYVVQIDHPELGRIRAVGCPVTFAKTPAKAQRPTPAFGQHTEEVLLDLAGCSWDDLARLKEEGVIP